ncbi:MAG: response regulator [Pseudobdellovibrio sp.]
MRTILFVDDSRLVAKLFDSMLKADFKILGHGRDGNEGLSLYKELKPDIVLLDITMPNCGGRECLVRILEHNPNASVIMVSSLTDQLIISECLLAGAKGYIIKDTISAKEENSSKELVFKILNIIDNSLKEAV